MKKRDDFVQESRDSVDKIFDSREYRGILYGSLIASILAGVFFAKMMYSAQVANEFINVALIALLGCVLGLGAWALIYISASQISFSWDKRPRWYHAVLLSLIVSLFLHVMKI